MKAQIQALIGRLEKMIESAEEKTESDNDSVVERYEQVIEGLTAAKDALEETLQAWGD
jgi:hypothetical protein